MSCYKRAPRPVQKVVIPKGMINPGETTIIEIPSSLQKQPIVVAKRKTSLDTVSFASKGSEKRGIKYDKRKVVGGARSPRVANQELEVTERKEREQFLKDLEEFQKARRKLLSNASFLAGEKNPPKLI